MNKILFLYPTGSYEDIVIKEFNKLLLNYVNNGK